MFVHAYNCVKIFGNVQTHIRSSLMKQITVNISLKNVLNAKLVFEGKFFLDISRFEHLRSANPRLTALPFLRNLILYQNI
jgi:hypothetical protein